MKQKINGVFKKYPGLSFISFCLLFVGIEGLYSFCSPKAEIENTRTCPAYSNTIFNTWFPYQVNENIIFASASAKDTITIGTITRSDQTQTFTSIPCTIFSSILSNQFAGNINKLLVTYNKVENEARNTFTISFYNFNLNNAWLKDSEITSFDQAYQTQYYSNIAIGGKSFNEVAEIKRDTITNKQSGVYKIYISKNNGLVGYERYPTLELFIKQ